MQQTSAQYVMLRKNNQGEQRHRDHGRYEGTCLAGDKECHPCFHSLQFSEHAQNCTYGLSVWTVEGVTFIFVHGHEGVKGNERADNGWVIDGR